MRAQAQEMPAVPGFETQIAGPKLADSRNHATKREGLETSPTPCLDFLCEIPGKAWLNNLWSTKKDHRPYEIVPLDRRAGLVEQCRDQAEEVERLADGHLAPSDRNLPFWPDRSHGRLYASEDIKAEVELSSRSDGFGLRLSGGLLRFNGYRGSSGFQGVALMVEGEKATEDLFPSGRADGIADTVVFGEGVDLVEVVAKRDLPSPAVGREDGFVQLTVEDA